MNHQIGFNNPAAFWRLYQHFHGYYSRVLDVLSSFAIDSPAQILDLGCGVGDFTHLLATRYPNASVTGIDVSPSYIAYAASRWKAHNLSFFVQTAERALNSYRRTVDTILVKGSYHLFEETLPLNALLSRDAISLRRVVVIEKTDRSIRTYPAPETAIRRRQDYVSPNLSQRRLSIPPWASMRSHSYGETIHVPRDDYLAAIRKRQFSYLAGVSDTEIAAWLEIWGQSYRSSYIKIFEENISNIYYVR